MSRPGGKDRGLFERPKGSGVWWIRYADAQGMEHREKVGSKSGAREVYQQRKTEIRQGKFDSEKVRQRRRWTVARMLEHYRAKRAQAGPRNQAEDQRYAEYWAEQFGRLELDQLRVSHLEAWMESRIQEVKPATVNRALTYLKAYFGLAVRDGLCKVNPVTQLKPLRENNERTRYLTDEEEGRLRVHIEAAEWDLVEFAILTGLRQQEQCRLAWTEVDLTAGVVTARETKAGKARHVPLGARAQAILQRQRERYPGSPWVFPAPTKPSVPITGKNLNRRLLLPALAAAGIQDFHWHDLRHSFGSRLAMKGVPLRTIQLLMGHGSIRMTERYAHLSPDNLNDAVRLLD